jgi:hypothetical protein
VRRLLAALALLPLPVVFAVGAGACGGGATTTTPGVSPEARIVVGQSIGPISIGLTKRRVIGLLGRPQSSFAVFSTARGPGTLARYESHGAELRIVYDSTGRVASIETYSPYYRTATGLGPGSSLARASRLPGFRQDFCELGYWNATRRTDRFAVVTVFTPNGGLVDSVLITQLRFDTNCAQAGRGLEPRPNIVVDRSIGGVSLGTPRAAVLKLLGRPASMRTVALGANATGTQVRYSIEGAPFLVTYDDAGRVVSVRAYSPFFFSPAGIGPGSRRAFVAALRGFVHDPCKVGFWNGAAHASPDRPVTVFTLLKGVVASVLITELRLFTPCKTR